MPLDKAIRAYLRPEHSEPARATPEDERRARVAIIREARTAGAVLTHPSQRGGLPPSLVLGVFRRDAWRCKVHGDAGEGENGGLQVHHKSKVLAQLSTWMQRKGGANDMNNLVTLCKRAHDDIHDRDRAVAEHVLQEHDAITPELAREAASKL